MRYKEFNLTEDELFELNMSPTNLSKMAKNIDARVGMEFELIVPNADVEDDEYETEPDYEYNESFPTGPGWTRDVIDFFTGGDYGESRSYIQRQIDELNENFYSWVSEDQEEFINSVEGQDRITEIAGDNVDRSDYETEEEYIAALQNYIDENEDSIRDQLIDEYNDDLDSKFEEWLEEQGIESMVDFHNEYDVAWPYYTEPRFQGGGVSIDAVADDFQQAIGRPVNASSSYHGATRQPGRYVVEPDSSLTGDEPGDGGLEFVSPPLTVDEMLSDIDKVATWAGRIGAYTNNSTGLHMNVSVPDQQNLDFVKLAMFLGDAYILEQFGREGNTYCKSVLKQIISTAKSEPERVTEMMRQFQGGLNDLASKILHTGQTSKYSSINNRGDWVEFRSPGGNWLGDDLSAVKNTMLRAVVALDVATKPEEFKQEYYKKLYKTLSQGQDNDTIQYFAKYAAGELPQSALKAFVRQIQGKRSAKKMAMGAKDILLVWKVTGSQNSPYQSQGIEVVALDEPGAYKEAINKWSLNLGGRSIEDYTQQNGWKAHPVRAATSNDMNQSSNKFYRVYVQGRSNGVWVRAMSEFQAKQLAVQRHADVFANAATNDIIAAHDPNYEGEETAISAIRARSGEPVPAGGIPGSTQDIQRRRQGAAQMPPINFDGNYEVYRVESGRTVYRFQADGVPEAYDMLQRWREFMMEPSLNPREFNVRAVAQTSAQTPVNSTPQQYTVNYTISHNGEVRNSSNTVSAANADAAMSRTRETLEQDGWRVDRIEAQPAQARGSESLPPGNARWLVLDRDDNEVYSFINTTAQSDANQYARDWMINRAPREVRDNGPFTIVPDPR